MRSDRKKPAKKQTSDSTADVIMTDRNCFATRMAESAGKMISPETMIAPTIFMPITTVTAVSAASIMLYTETCTPVAFAKFVSNVTLKMRV